MGPIFFLDLAWLLQSTLPSVLTLIESCLTSLSCRDHVLSCLTNDSSEPYFGGIGHCPVITAMDWEERDYTYGYGD